MTRTSHGAAIEKKTAAPELLPQTLDDYAEVSAQIDELGALERELAMHAPKISRVEHLRKAIRAFFDARPADKPIEALGARYLAMLGQRALVKTVNNVKLIKAIGGKRFASIATVTQAALEREGVDPLTRALVISEARTGLRSLKTVERPEGLKGKP